jgi:NTP pyrophosphatase (non-canonical NTP hydrolase)
MGYHLKEIQKGILGEFSKIEEEFLELQDGVKQNHPLLQLCEMADLIGAVEAYAKKFNITLEDLIKMKNSTKSAFEEGKRK